MLLNYINNNTHDSVSKQIGLLIYTPLIKHYLSSSCGVNNIHSNTNTNLKIKEIF